MSHCFFCFFFKGRRRQEFGLELSRLPQLSSCPRHPVVRTASRALNQLPRSGEKSRSGCSPLPSPSSRSHGPRHRGPPV